MKVLSFVLVTFYSMIAVAWLPLSQNLPLDVNDDLEHGLRAESMPQLHDDPDHKAFSIITGDSQRNIIWQSLTNIERKSADRSIAKQYASKQTTKDKDLLQYKPKTESLLANFFKNKNRSLPVSNIYTSYRKLNRKKRSVDESTDTDQIKKDIQHMLDVPTRDIDAGDLPAHNTGDLNKHRNPSSSSSSQSPHNSADVEDTSPDVDTRTRTGSLSKESGLNSQPQDSNKSSEESRNQTSRQAVNNESKHTETIDTKPPGNLPESVNDDKEKVDNTSKQFSNIKDHPLAGTPPISAPSASVNIHNKSKQIESVLSVNMTTPASIVDVTPTMNLTMLRQQFAKHRNRSRDVTSATVCVSAILVMLIGLVLYSRMWERRDQWITMNTTLDDKDCQDIPIHTKLSIKDIIEGKLRLLQIQFQKFEKFKRHKIQKKARYKRVDQHEGTIDMFNKSGSDEEIYSR